MKRILTTAVFALAVSAFAKLEPAALFNDNMVLQRDRKVAVWGTADAGAEVTVVFAGAKVVAKAGADGAWRVNLPAMAACREGREMTISTSTGDKVVYRNAVVGEVWLCGGQSNMTFAMWPNPSIGQHAGRERNGYYDIMLTDEPDVRGVNMPQCWSGEPKNHARLSWFTFTPGNGGGFSGCAWHYAMRLYRSLKVPVGVIECAWGGSCIETWIPAEAYAASKSFKELAKKPIRTEMTEKEKEVLKKSHRGPSLHQQPRACWNAMVYPLAPYGIRGAIWYQGCTNRGKWREYYEMLETLRSGWGKKFEVRDLPFFLCQIAPYGYTTEEKDEGATEIREEMERFGLSNGNNVGTAILSDVGEVDNIHPGDKRTVATRLAALALNRIYGFKQIKCDAPVFEKATLAADGKTVELAFRNVESWCRNGTYEPRFELAGADGKYVQVASVLKPKTNTITLKVPVGLVPERVVYMRKSCVHGFIKNEAGLPIGPFRAKITK